MRFSVIFDSKLRLITLTGCDFSMTVFTLTIANVEHLPSLTTETRAIPDTGVVQMAVHHIHEHKTFPTQRFLREFFCKDSAKRF